MDLPTARSDIDLVARIIHYKWYGRGWNLEMLRRGRLMPAFLQNYQVNCVTSCPDTVVGAECFVFGELATTSRKSDYRLGGLSLASSVRGHMAGCY